MNKKALIVPVLGLSAMLLTGCFINTTTVKVQQGNETTIHHNVKVNHYDGLIAIHNGSHTIIVPQNATVDITKG